MCTNAINWLHLGLFAARLEVGGPDYCRSFAIMVPRTNINITLFENENFQKLLIRHFFGYFFYLFSKDFSPIYARFHTVVIFCRKVEEFGNLVCCAIILFYFRHMLLFSYCSFCNIRELFRWGCCNYDSWFSISNIIKHFIYLQTSQNYNL